MLAHLNLTVSNQPNLFLNVLTLFALITEGGKLFNILALSGKFTRGLYSVLVGYITFM